MVCIAAIVCNSLCIDAHAEDGISAFGYTKADIPALVRGTMPQVRVHIALLMVDA